MRPHERGLGENEFLLLTLPLYGLCESGDYWGETLSSFCVKAANLKQTPWDLSLFYCRMAKDLCTLSGNYVDDLIRSAPAEQPPELEASLRSQIEFSSASNLLERFLGYELSGRRQGCVLR